MGIHDEFNDATAAARILPHQSNETLLELYGLFKQATEGDAENEGPGIFDLVGQAKHDAWDRHRGTPREEAMRRYVALVRTLQQDR
jgi:diazepam-binding inhibitor (GABA receptor modulator, acyl-CoA-binding protein)